MVAEKDSMNLFNYFNRICTVIENKMNQSLKDIGLTRAQFEIIVFIVRQVDKKTTQRNIEKVFGLSHTTVIGILKRLEKNGFIKVSVDLKDRRQRIVSLSEKALDLETEVLKAHKEMNERFLQNFTDEQMELFEKALKILHDSIVDKQ